MRSDRSDRSDDVLEHGQSHVTTEYLIVSGAEVKRSVAVRVLCVDVSAVEQKMLQVLNTTAKTHLSPTACRRQPSGVFC